MGQDTPHQQVAKLVQSIQGALAAQQTLLREPAHRRTNEYVEPLEWRLLELLEELETLVPPSGPPLGREDEVA